MRSRVTEWFETKIKYDKTQEDGTLKPETELYVVDALSFAEAESTITEEMSAYISGDFMVKDIKKAAYHEIFFSDVNIDDRWWKVKLKFITMDEKTQKEKETAQTYLVQAHTLQSAAKYIDEEMGKGMSDYRLASITETSIMDVFEHKAKNGPVKEDKPEYVEEGV